MIAGIVPLETHVWVITGVSPLMHSNPFSMGVDDGKGGLTVKKKYDDDDELAMRCYAIDKEGQLVTPEKDKNGRLKLPRGVKYVHPTSSFRKAMIVAVTSMKFGKVAARNVIGSAVFPAEEYTQVLGADAKPVKTYEKDKRPALVQKARIMRVRPKFTEWKLRLALDIDSERIGLEQVTQALNLAGRNIGVGEFRPDPSDGKKGVGTYGRFYAELEV